MKLQSLQIRNYRNFIDSGIIPYHDLTIFVGENNTGKTTVIDALSLLLQYGRAKPTADEFVDKAQPIEIEGSFIVSVSDTARNIDKFIINGTLTYKYCYDLATGSVKYIVKCLTYENPQLNNYESLKSQELKDLVISLGIRPESTILKNHEVISEYIVSSSPTKVPGEVEISWNDIKPYTPILQRYSSNDYTQPENLVRRTLETIYRTHFYEINEETGEEKLKSDFGSLKKQITQDLDQNINNQLKDQLGRHLDNISAVGGDYNIDFSKGLILSGIIITFANGDKKSINQLGDGHRKKATLAVLEWDAQVSDGSDDVNIIKAYDEPDTNLDFAAQRKIFATINKDAKDNENILAVICTHSLALIDRAPALSINRILLDENGARVDFLQSNGDDDIRQFLSEVAEVSGLRNSSIFYEKAFVVVEGDSEAGGLEILYRTYTGQTMAEDGIVLINLKTNGQWNNVLKFLGANKSDVTTILLDSDTQQSGSSSPVTPQKLSESGFDSSFLQSNCFFIGIKEFEDTYTDECLATMANSEYPRVDGRPWTHTDFCNLRTSDKFSNDIIKIIFQEHGSPTSKPEVGRKMALLYNKEMVEQNTALKALFDKLQSIISA